MLIEPQQVAVHKILDVRVALLVFPVLQPSDTEYFLVYPALQTLERDDPGLDSFLFEAGDAEAERMEQIEVRILTGAPVSAADRAAWRRWANRAAARSLVAIRGVAARPWTQVTCEHVLRKCSYDYASLDRELGSRSWQVVDGFVQAFVGYAIFLKTFGMPGHVPLLTFHRRQSRSWYCS